MFERLTGGVSRGAAREGARCPAAPSPPARPAGSVPPRLRAARPVPALARDIHGGAQRDPDLFRSDPDRQSLLGGAVAERSDHEVAHQGASVRATELVVDGAEELAAGHAGIEPCRALPEERAVR